MDSEKKFPNWKTRKSKDLEPSYWADFGIFVWEASHLEFSTSYDQVLMLTEMLFNGSSWKFLLTIHMFYYLAYTQSIAVV